MNIFHYSKEFTQKHKRHHHIALASLALIIVSTSAYIYRQDIAKIAYAATYTFTQASWAGGVTANTATHTSNQSGWTQYSATSTSIVAGAGGVSLLVTSKSAVDEGVGLSSLSPATIATQLQPQKVITSNDGTSVYAINYTSGSISMYQRNVSTGALTALSPASINSGSCANGLVVSPDDKFLYAGKSCGTGGNGFQYSRNTTTGALTALSPSFFTSQTNYDIRPLSKVL